VPLTDRVRVMSSRVGCVTAILLLVVTAACDENTVSPTLVSTGSSVPVVNLTGTWSGTASDSFGQFRMVLVLTQSDSAVTGSMTGTTLVGDPLYSDGTVSGTISESTFAFTIAVPLGGITDAPACTASFVATTTDLLATSMSGAYAGADTCGRTFPGGRFQLIKE
jgi:hypothetical protein